MSQGPGRNQPCPCGSGRKYKVCCQVKDAVARVAGARLVEMTGPKKIQGPGVLMLTPSRTGRNRIEFTSSVAATDGIVTIWIPKKNLGVVEARNALVQGALLQANRSGYDPSLGWYVLWADDDAMWQSGAFTMMFKAILVPGVDILAGWFCGRAAYQGPKAYMVDGSWPKPGKAGQPDIGDVVEVDRVGMHFVLHKLDLLNEMVAKYGPNLFDPTDSGELGEDMAFCRRARDMGKRIWVHTGCGIAHVDDNGIGYLPGEGPMKVEGSELHKMETLRDYGESLDGAKKDIASSGTVLA